MTGNTGQFSKLSHIRLFVLEFMEVQNMLRDVKIIIEKHSDGYVAYPLGLKGAVIGAGDTFMKRHLPTLNRPFVFMLKLSARKF